MAEDRDLNRDPLSDEPGAHPVGTGVGAAGGAVAGAAAGMVGGPLGMAVGGVVGAVVGGLAGKAAAEAVNPTAEEAHWRENYHREPYYEKGRSFDDYGPAYRHGMEARSRYDDWDAAQPHMASEWEKNRGSSSLSWEQAHPASRAAWERVDSHYRSGDLSQYGTGTPSSDSSYPTGGTNDTYNAAGSYGNGAGTSGRPGMTGGGTMDSRTAIDRLNDASARSTDTTSGSMGTSSTGSSSMASSSTGSTMGTSAMASPSRADTGVGGAAAAVGAVQSAGDRSGSTEDVRDALEDLLEVCKDGEYGFRECADQARRSDIKSMLSQRAEDCRRGGQEIQDLLRQYGGNVDEGGSAMGALHRGWVSVKATLSTYDDKAVLEEAERGEDNALARYRKAMNKPLPENVMQVVNRQCQGVQRNHDQVRMLRDQLRSGA